MLGLKTKNPPFCPLSPARVIVDALFPEPVYCDGGTMIGG